MNNKLFQELIKELKNLNNEMKEILNELNGIKRAIYETKEK